jgi:predicted MFS family arabinose efflux permease
VEDRRDLGNAIALNSTMFNLARIIGPAVGGVVLASLGATWCFSLNGLSFLAVLLALFRMRFPKQVIESKGDPLVAQIKVGLAYIWSNAPVRTIIALVGVSSLFGTSYATLLPAYAADVLHVEEAGLGMLSAAVGAGALVGSLTIAALGGMRRKGMVLTFGNLFYPTALLLLSMSRSLVASLCILPLIGLGFVLQNATANTLVQSIVSDELRGRVMAVYMLMFFGTAPFGALWAGTVAQALGPTTAIAIGGGITLAFALVVLFAVPLLRKLEG